MFNKKNRKSQENNYILSSFNRLEHRIVSDQSELLDLCNVLLENRALLANFEQLSVDEANYMLTFLSGAVYALKGEVHKIHPKTFLFASESEYLDGTLKQYLIERTNSSDK